MPKRTDKTPRTAATAHKPVTAEDVARAAGVSYFTVQRVFNRPARVSEKTREHVLSVAREMGYSPDAAGRALSTGKSFTTALVLLKGRLHSNFVEDTFEGFYDSMAARGFEVVISIVPQDHPPARWVQRLVASKRCDSLAVHLETADRDCLRDLAALRIPLVVLYGAPGRRAEHAGLSSVAIDNESGIRQATLHLVALGHREIAYFGGTPNWPDSPGREAGFRAAMREARLRPNEQWVIACDFDASEESTAQALAKTMGAFGKRPTAVVCASDMLARGVVNAARRWNLAVPAGLSVTGFDNDNWSQYHWPPLTTVGFPAGEAGQAAAAELLRHYDDPAAPPKTILLPTALIVRDSTGPPPGRTAPTKTKPQTT